MISWERMEATRLRMLAARKVLEDYVSAPHKHDPKKFNRLSARLEVATEEYLELVGTFLREQSSGEHVLPDKKKRPA